MKEHTCEKCGKFFYRKSGYIDHINRKFSCIKNEIKFIYNLIKIQFITTFMPFIHKLAL